MESLSKCKEWAEAFSVALAAEEIERQDGPNTLLKSGSITFDNGSRILAVPGRPDTVRGFSANLVLTEFAFFEDPDATWRAVLPSITNPSGAVRKRSASLLPPTARRVVAPGRTRSSTTTCLTPGRAASSTGPAMW